MIQEIRPPIEREKACHHLVNPLEQVIALTAGTQMQVVLVRKRTVNPAKAGRVILIYTGSLRRSRMIFTTVWMEERMVQGIQQVTHMENRLLLQALQIPVRLDIDLMDGIRMPDAPMNLRG